jgi:hypothetical protein
MACLLSILIPTIPEREYEFKRLWDFINMQLNSEVELLFYLSTRQEMSIGKKREKLYRQAKGQFSVQIDDDDFVSDDFVSEILAAIKSDPKVDCIGYYEEVQMNQETKKSKISKTSVKWHSISEPDAEVSFYRTPFFKCPIRTVHCQSIGVADMRFGEDLDFSNRIYPLLSSEIFIHKTMYYYKCPDLSRIELSNRYGL